MIEAQPHQPKRSGRLHPVLIILVMTLAAIALTHLVPAGRFQRHGKQVIPGTYHVIAKVNGIPALLAPTAPSSSQTPARAAGVVSLFAAIPEGMTKSADLIFMVMFVGGMFGVLRATGAIEAAIDRLLHAARGNVYLLTAALMLLLACGSTFLGFISEYLAVIPIMLALAKRLQLPNLFAPAVVCVASMVGYAASVTNPIVLGVAQPLAGVPIFSALTSRLVIFVVLLSVSIGYVLLYIRRLSPADHRAEMTKLTTRHFAVLTAIILGGAGLVTGTSLWAWGPAQDAAAFIALALLLALVGGLHAESAIDAFLDGMRALLLPGVMIGLAGAMEIILRSSQILDSIVQEFALVIHGHAAGVVASGIMVAEMVFDVLIHSTSAKAAISLPILTPIAQLSGVDGQVSVIALILGGGLTNLVAPTNGLLLAFLAASNVGYGQWIRFVAPLFAILCLGGVVSLYVCIRLGI